MGDDFDNFANNLQEQIFEETKATYGQAAFQRWMKPLYMGKIDSADGYGRVSGSCGDTMEIFLKFEKGRVKQATFLTDGCGSSAVCGSFAAELAMGKTPDELIDITGQTILEILGGLPEKDQHCAFLGAEAVQESLHNYMMHQNRKR